MCIYIYILVYPSKTPQRLIRKASCHEYIFMFYANTRRTVFSIQLVVEYRKKKNNYYDSTLLNAAQIITYPY